LNPPLPAALVVDDHLALVAALGALVLPGGVVGTPTTTYAWQLRLSQALVAERTTTGALQRLASLAGVTKSEALFRVTRPDPRLLDVVDPRAFVWDVASHRVAHSSNQLAAETIAVARHMGAVVRVVEANSRGHLHDQVVASGLEFGVWRLRGVDGGLTPEE
jgi:hypothetical protein